MTRKSEMKTNPAITESTINIISEGTHLQGKLTFDQVSRIHGTLTGEINANEGSTLILAETSVVEGIIHAETLIVEGYVQGDIHATKKVFVSGTGRVIGNIQTPSLSMDFGAYFDGQCSMPEQR